MASTSVGDVQRLCKVEPINQPYIMFHWSRGWAALPKSDEAGSSPAWSTIYASFVQLEGQ